jgi:hypothetical protein
MDQAPPADASASASAFSFLSGDAPAADSAPVSMFADLDLKAAPETAPETSMFDLAGLVVRSPPEQIDAAPAAAPSFDFMMGSRSRGASVAASAPSPVPAALPAVSEAKPSGLPAMAPLPVSNDDDDILAAALTKGSYLCDMLLCKLEFQSLSIQPRSAPLRRKLARSDTKSRRACVSTGLP